MTNFVKKIRTSSGETAPLYDIYAASADTAISAQTALYANVAKAMAGVWVNDSGNFEINSSLGEYTSEDAKAEAKLNLVSDAAIQIKPGDGEPLQLDCEKNVTKEDDKYEYSVKTCNGIFPKATRTVALKLNTAEITLDTQKANTDKFSTDSMDVKFRYDKWNGGEVVSETGPIGAKLKARSFDIRCHDHGGIALQIAGRDSTNHENKIKFESDRIVGLSGTKDSNLPSTAYCKEGGKGVEFGTFNNEHTSLFTGDYRFKGDAMVYGVTRSLDPINASGKIDYHTQADDFKDIVPLTGASWNEIVGVARAYADGQISGGGSTSGGSSADMSNYATTAMLQTVNTAVAAAQSDATMALAKANALSSATAVAANQIFRKKNGNLEVTTEGLGHYATDNDPSTEIHPSPAVMYANVTEYNTDKGTSLTEEEFAALTEAEKIKTPAVLADPATLDLVSDDKVAIKCNELEIGAPTMAWAVEVSKKNKVTLGGKDYYPVSPTDEDANKAATYEQMKALFPSLGVNIEKNNSTTTDIKNLGTGFIGINILDLVSLVSKVASLEARVAALENPQ